MKVSERKRGKVDPLGRKYDERVQSSNSEEITNTLTNFKLRHDE